MIYGIGSDLIHIPRIEKLVDKFGTRFLYRVYTEKEVQASYRFSDNKPKFFAYFAKRFTAKEAFVKAIGTGFGADVAMKDIEILNHKSGRPILSLLPGARKHIEEHVIKAHISNIHVTLSDDFPIAQAFVVVEVE